MVLELNTFSDKGEVRDRNEDMILCGTELIRDSGGQKLVEIINNSRFIVAIADGMGGHNRGDLASEIVCKDLSCFIQGLPTGLSAEQLDEELNSWIQSIHLQIIHMGKQDSQLQGMGTTLVGLLFYEDKILWINCGDSRIYRLRNKILSQLSIDHSLSALTLNPKIPTNIITNSIGAGPTVYLDIQHMTGFVYSGDAFLLCSDGLTDTLDDDIIEEMLLNSSVDELISYAMKAGATDNISACLIKIINQETK